MKKVLLEAPILTKSGYGEHARLIYRTLKQDKGLDIYINPLAWGTTSWKIPDKDILDATKKYANYNHMYSSKGETPHFDIQIRVGIPNEFEKKAPFSICVTAGIESDRVSPNWIIKTHQGIDKLIVPSEHAKRGFVNTNYEVVNNANGTKTMLGCNSPIDVVPYPIKAPSGAPLDLEFSTGFNFLSIALLGPRKNIEFMLKGFVETFRDNDNIGLILKTAKSRSSKMDRIETKSRIENYIKSLGEKKCKIYLLHGDLTEAEIHSLYTHSKVKAYVSTTHGEGYGLPVFEAAYSGLPVIATDWSGHLDFLSGNLKGKNKKLFARIDYDLKEVQKEAVWKDILTEESKWAYPKQTSYKAQLEKVHANYGMYKKWANILKSEIEENFSEEAVMSQMRSALMLKDSEDTVNEIDNMFASLASE